MRKLIVTLILGIGVLVPVVGVLASVDCPSSGCTVTEVGPFMSGISESCGETGTCSFADIEAVFSNVGNWILGVVGALVLLAYVVGGFYFLISGMPGMEKFREKGKTALKQSTVGLVIVFVAFAAIKTLDSVLRGGDVGSTDTYVSCGPGNVNSGESCALNSRCTDAGMCVSQCEIENPYSSNAGVVSWAACKDVNDATTNYGYGLDVQKVSGPTPNKCPGNEDIQCFTFSYTLN
jgi:hypothetical protein